MMFRMSERTLLTGARVLTMGARTEPADVLIEDGRITAVGPGLEADDAQTVGLSGHVVAPGFIDLHVHGGGGHALITPDAAEIEAYGRWAVSQGVTSFLATVCAPTLDAALGCLAACANARRCARLSRRLRQRARVDRGRGAPRRQPGGAVRQP